MAVNTAACLLGLLTLSTSAPTLLVDTASVNGRLTPPTTFAPDCGIVFSAACRLAGTRTNWTVTAWAPSGQLSALTTQRDSDLFPVALTTVPWPAAYRTLVVQRTTTGPQWIEARATRVDGCQATMRVEVR